MVCHKEQSRTLLKSKILFDKNWKVLNYFLQGEALDAFVSPETLDGNNQVCLLQLGHVIMMSQRFHAPG